MPSARGPKAATFEIIAGLVRSLPEEHKQPVADHFADELNKRFPSFDPGAWEDRCGGRLGAVNFAEREEAARKARVEKYLSEIEQV